jgi:hypothetical protein
MDSFELGRTVPLSGNNTVDFYFTNFLWRDDQWCGPGQGAILVPTANGTYTDGTPNGAAQLWQCVDEAPPDGPDTFINGLSQGQAATFKMSGFGAGFIQSVRPYPFVCKDSGVGQAAMLTRLVSNGVTVDIVGAGSPEYDFNNTTFNPGTGFNATRCLTADPSTGLVWTPASLSQIEAGLVQKTAGANIACTSVYVFVDYSPSAPYVPLASPTKVIQLTGTVRKTPMPNPFTNPNT